MRITPLDVKQGYRDWFRREVPQFAFTGSAKQALTSKLCRLEWVSVDALAINTAHVMERVSRDVFGRRAVRKGARLRYCGCVEGSREIGSRLHVHLAVAGIPNGIEPSDFAGKLASRWRLSRWGHREVLGENIPAGRGEGWYNYILKAFDANQTERWFANY